MNRSRCTGRGKPLRSLFLWHRWLGLGLALFAVVLSLTGMMLNHTEALGLNERRVISPWLLNVYGIVPPPLAKAFKVEDQWVSQWGDRLFLDTAPVEATGPLHGAMRAAGMVVVAGEDELILLGQQGQLVERFPVPGLQAIGQAGGRLVVRTEEALLRADEQLIGWMALSGADTVAWSANSEGLPGSLRRAIERRLQGEGLPLERIVLDVHSGRIFGSAGVWVMDGAAAVLLFSAISGVWLWLRHRLRRRRARA